MKSPHSSVTLILMQKEIKLQGPECGNKNEHHSTMSDMSSINLNLSFIWRENQIHTDAVIKIQLCKWGDRNSFSSHMCSIKEKVAITALQAEIDWLTICRFAFTLTQSWKPQRSFPNFLTVARKRTQTRWQCDGGITTVLQGMGSSRTSGLWGILGTPFCTRHLGSELLEPGSVGMVLRFRQEWCSKFRHLR